MMIQYFYIAGALAIYSTCDWLMTAGAEFILHLLGVA